MKTKYIVLQILIVGCFLMNADRAFAQEPIWDANKIVLTTKQLAPNVYGVFPQDDFDAFPNNPKGTGGGFIVGKDGVLVIESFLNGDLASQLIAQVRKVTSLPIKFLVNTSYHGDHSYGNYVFPSTTTIIQHKGTKEYVEKNFTADTIWMKQNFGKGRGIEKVIPRTGDILIDRDTDIDLGGRTVQIKNFGFGQTVGDLYVWDAVSKTLWVGNVIVCPEPGIPWMLDGRHEEVLATLKAIRDFLPDDATIVPGHFRPIKKEEINFSINYVQALHDGVKKAIKEKKSLEQIKATLKMDEFNKGYLIWDWLHYSVNIPNTYKDLTSGQSATKNKN